MALSLPVSPAPGRGASALTWLERHPDSLLPGPGGSSLLSPTGLRTRPPQSASELPVTPLLHGLTSLHVTSGQHPAHLGPREGRRKEPVAVRARALWVRSRCCSNSGRIKRPGAGDRGTSAGEPGNVTAGGRAALQGPICLPPQKLRATPKPAGRALGTGAGAGRGGEVTWSHCHLRRGNQGWGMSTSACAATLSISLHRLSRSGSLT